MRCEEASPVRAQEKKSNIVPVLGAAVIALAHAASRVVGFPKPPQNVHKRHFLRVVHHSHPFRVASCTAARLILNDSDVNITSTSVGKLFEQHQQQKVRDNF